MKKFYTIFISLLAVHAFSQSGNLDATFGNNGKIYTGFGASNSRANAVAVQPDGKIIVGGYAYTANTVNGWEKDSDNFSLVRYNTDGSIDTTFGYGGKVMTDFYTFFSNNNYRSEIYFIKLQPDGKIVVYGGASTQAVIARYNTDGSLDTGFGNNGKVGCNSSPVIGGQGNTIAIQPDGKIVVLGVQWTQPVPNTYNTQFSIERYNIDGTNDTTFANNGMAITAFGTGYDSPMAITLQPDGKIIAVGGSYNSQLAMARYTANGALDTTFDGDGKVITSFGAGTFSSAKFVTVHPDGKIVVAGIMSPTTGIAINFTLARYNTNGSLDTGFDGDGKAINAFDTTDASYNINTIVEQPDGKFLVTTSADPYGSYDVADDFVTRRYNADATIDTSFGTNGKAATTCQEGFNQAKNTAIQPDGKIIVVGYSRPISSQQNDSNTIRYHSNGTLDTTFGTGGKVTSKFDSTNDESNILLIQPDNKLIAIGTKRNHTDNGYLFKDIAISRYNSNGSLDDSFGTEGKVVSSFGQNMNEINKAVLQADGKIVVENTYYNTSVDNLYHYELIRYTASGAIDATFGTNGKVAVDVEPQSILSQPDGKIITISYMYDSQNNAFLALKRYNNNGTSDNSFGINGISSIAGTFWASVTAVLQPDGKIVVSYSGPNVNEANGMIVKRFNANGTLDNGFESNGAIIIDNACYANGVFIQPDGKIIVTGRSMGFADSYVFFEFVAARYNTNGSLDTTYGTDGVVASYLGNYFTPYIEIQSVVLQPDGKFLVALTKTDPNAANPTPDSYDFVIYRFNANGGLDNDFGGDGDIVTSFYNKYDEAFAMVLQPDNKIVVAGTTDTGINRDFAIARYENVVILESRDFDEDNGLILYPNPVKNILNLAGTDAQEIIGYTIFDMLGKVIYSGTDLQVDATNFSRGIYNIRINTNKGIVNKKFIKE